MDSTDEIRRDGYVSAELEGRRGPFAAVYRTDGAPERGEFPDGSLYGDDRPREVALLGHLRGYVAWTRGGDLQGHELDLCRPDEAGTDLRQGRSNGRTQGWPKDQNTCRDAAGALAPVSYFCWEYDSTVIRRSILRGLVAGVVLGFVQAIPGLSRVPVTPERPILPLNDGNWAIMRETTFTSPDAALAALRASGRRPLLVSVYNPHGVILVMSHTERWRIIPHPPRYVSPVPFLERFV